MKKIIALLLALAVLLSLAGCVKTDVLPENEGEELVEEPIEEEPYEEEYVEPPAEENEYGFDVTPTIEETVLYNEKGLKITAKALNYGYYDASLELLFENTTGATWSYSGASNICGYVNGCTFPDFMFGEIPAGESVTDVLSFDYYTLAHNGIKTIKEMGVALCLTDEDWNETEIGPFSVKTSAYDGSAYDEEAFFNTISDPAALALFSETVLYSEKCDAPLGGGIRMIAKAVIEDDINKYLDVQFVNDSESSVNVSVCDVKLNGISFPENGYRIITLEPHCGGVMSYTITQELSKETLEALDLYNFGEITYSVSSRGAKDEFGEFEEIYNETIAIDGGKKDVSFEKVPVYDKNGLVISSIGIYPASWEGEAVFALYVENKSGKNITLSCPDSVMKVNGNEAECYNLYAILPDGYSGLSYIFASDLEGAGVASYADITSYELKLNVTDYDLFTEMDTVTFSVNINKT